MDHSFFCERYMQLEKDHLERHIPKTPSTILRLFDKSVPSIPASHPLKFEVRSLLGQHAKVLHPYLCVNQDGLFLRQTCEQSKTFNWYILQNAKTNKQNFLTSVPRNRL